MPHGFLLFWRLAKSRRYINQAKYWEARAYERAGNEGEANLLFQDLVSQFPLTYYGQLAGIRLHGPPVSKSSGSQRSLSQPSLTGGSSPPWLTGNVNYQKANELISLGLEKEANHEVQALVNSLSLNPQNIQEILPVLIEVKAYDQALRLARKFFRDDDIE